MELNNGVSIPDWGYGIYQTPNVDTKKAVLSVLSVDYWHIDTAAFYSNEVGVWQVIQESGLVAKLFLLQVGFEILIAITTKPKRLLPK